ncbi:MAG TPA: hypothetical protein VN176_07700 [Verrucomicrobiae bacterium]|jgi:hypothetical protein|nr:hypothetical protein [Verrucomicrobiae bacterium]
MNLLISRVVVLLAAVVCGSVAAQPWNAPGVQPSDGTSAEFRLYRPDIKTRKQTKTVAASELRSGGVIYQVFRSRSGQQDELFRVAVGEAGGPNAPKLWNYGIVDEADFNGDGLPDYSWYGGDDTGFAMYLFLSSDHGYTRISLTNTLEAAWKQRFHTDAPKLDNVDGDYSIGNVRLKRVPSGLVLVANVGRSDSDGKRKKAYLFSIAQQDFRF